MEGQLVNEVCADLFDKLTAADLELVKKFLSIRLQYYNVSQKSTELTVYEPFPECAKVYLITRVIEGISKSTAKMYELRLRQFFEGVNKPLEDINANDIRIFLYKYQDGRGVSNRTLDNFRTIICTFFKWAASEKYIEIDPCANIKKIKYARKPKEPLSETELEQIRSACKDVRETAIIETLFSTGCRVTEAINIKVEDINFERGEIEVVGKGNKQRTVFLNAKAKYWLKKYLDERKIESPYVLAKARRDDKQSQLTKAGLEYIIAEIGNRSEIGRTLHPHLIRHTTATLALKRGMPLEDIQRMLGHENINTTLVYAKVDDDAVKRGHEKSIV